MVSTAFKLFYKLRDSSLTVRQLPNGKREDGVEVWFSLDELRELERILMSYDDLLSAAEKLALLKYVYKQLDPDGYERLKPKAWEDLRKAIAKAYGEDYN